MTPALVGRRKRKTRHNPGRTVRVAGKLRGNGPIQNRKYHNNLLSEIPVSWFSSQP